MKRYLSITAGLALCTAGSVAQADRPQLLSTGAPQRLLPQRVAQLGPDGRLIGDWMTIDDGGIAGLCTDSVIFDCLETDEFGNLIGGLDCGLEGENERHYFGETYCNLYAINDMIAGPDTDLVSERVGLAWFWYVEGPGTDEPCYIVIETFDDFDDTCNGPPADNRLSGIVMEFGLTAYGAYFTDVPLCDLGVSLAMPLDGEGAYSVILGNAYNSDTGEITLATCGQPFLWGTGDGEDPPDGRIGSQGPVEWDDDDGDGLHTAPDECFDNSLGVCPDPLGAAVKFWGESTETPPCMVLDIGPLVGGRPGVFTISDAEPNRLVAVIYSLRGCTGTYVDQGPLSDSGGREWCLSLGLDIALRDLEGQQVTAGRTDGTGFFQAQVPIPPFASGLTIGFQAFTQGTCPEFCGSECFEILIE